MEGLYMEELIPAQTLLGSNHPYDWLPLAGCKQLTTVEMSKTIFQLLEILYCVINGILDSDLSKLTPQPRDLTSLITCWLCR